MHVLLEISAICRMPFLEEEALPPCVDPCRFIPLEFGPNYMIPADVTPEPLIGSCISDLSLSMCCAQGLDFWRPDARSVFQTACCDCFGGILAGSFELKDWAYLSR